MRIKTNRKHFVIYSIFIFVTFLIFSLGSLEIVKLMNENSDAPPRFIELLKKERMTHKEYEEFKKLELQLLNNDKSSISRFRTYSSGHFYLAIAYAIFCGIFWFFNQNIRLFWLTGLATFIVLIASGGSFFQVSMWSLISISIHFFITKIKSKSIV